VKGRGTVSGDRRRRKIEKKYPTTPEERAVSARIDRGYNMKCRRRTLKAEEEHELLLRSQLVNEKSADDSAREVERVDDDVPGENGSQLVRAAGSGVDNDGGEEAEGVDDA
jgi:hypothetical protein